MAETVPRYRELTGLEKDIILFLSNKQTNITVNKLSEFCKINRSLASRILSDMEEDGIIVKTRNEKNRKEIFISLTSLGDEFANGLKNRDNKHALVMFL